MARLIPLVVAGGLLAWAPLPAHAGEAGAFLKAGEIGRTADMKSPACADPKIVRPLGTLPCVPAEPDPTAPAAERTAIALQRLQGLFRLGHGAEAAQQLAIAMTLEPASAEVWLMSSRLKLSAMDFAGARADVDHALSLDPADADALATRGYLEEEASASLGDYDRALALDPVNVFALEQRSALHQRMGDRAAADADLARLAAIVPLHPAAVEWRIQQRMAARDVDGLVAEIARSSADDPTAFATVLRRASLLQRLGAHDRAVVDYTTILGTTGTPRYAISAEQAGQLRFARARSLHALGRFDEARADIGRATAVASRRLVLQLQVFLHTNGFDDLDITGVSSPAMTDAALACMANPGCGNGLASRI